MSDDVLWTFPVSIGFSMWRFPPFGNQSGDSFLKVVFLRRVCEHSWPFVFGEDSSSSPDAKPQKDGFSGAELPTAAVNEAKRRDAESNEPLFVIGFEWILMIFSG